MMKNFISKLIICLFLLPGLALAQISHSTDTAQTVTGTITCNAGTNLNTSALATSANQTTANSSLSSIDGKITACNTGAVVISSSALPSGAATAAKQPALGTAGSASADVITVQGIASMTALKVDGSAVTQPVSGTITVTDGSGALNVIVDSSALPSGASTAAKQPALGTAGSASSDVITVQGISSMTALVVDGSGVTQPVSGTVTATLSSSTNAGATAKTSDFDTGGGTDTVTGFGILLPASGGAVVGGTSTNPLQVSLANTASNSTAVKVDGSAVTQPISAASLPTHGVTVASGGIASGGIASGAVASGAVASGAYASGSIASGALASGSIAAGAFAVGATSIADNEDVGSADADRGIKVLFRRTNSPANTSGSDLDYEMPQMAAGRVWVSATIDAALPAGTNAIGKLAANSGVDIGDVDVTSLTVAAGSTSIAENEDVSASGGDRGIKVLAFINETGAAEAADGDYAFPSIDTKGRHIVTGQIANDSALAGFPIAIGGYARSSFPTAVSNADSVWTMHDLIGRLAVSPYGIPEMTADGFATDATGNAFDVLASQGAGNRTVVTTWSVSNNDASTDGDVILISNATNRWQVHVARNSTVVVTFPNGLRANATATAWKCDGPAVSITCSISAYYIPY